MKKRTTPKTVKWLVVFSVVLAFSSILLACDWLMDGSNPNTFDWDLRGTWVSNDIAPRYSGSLIIEMNRITIKDYSESQTLYPGGNDLERPFRNFIKGVALQGYSNEGKIFIQDAGAWKEGIPYTYWTESSGFTKTELLRFEFGGRQETLKKQ